MSESQEFRFVNTTHPDLIDMPSRTLRTSGVEWVLNSDQKNVFFVNKTTGERTHQVILDANASCSNCTELRRDRHESSDFCSPLRLTWELKGSYKTVFLWHLDNNEAVCPLYLTWENPPLVNFVMRILTAAEEIKEIKWYGLDTLEQFPNV